VNAEGESLADLLDTYMKNCSKDRNIKPFGGGLFENYTYAWTPKGDYWSFLLWVGGNSSISGWWSTPLLLHWKGTVSQVKLNYCTLNSFVNF